MKQSKHRDLSGLKFGKLTALHINGRNSKKLLLWKCICECGEEINVTVDHLTSGNTQSCGCLKKLGIIKTAQSRFNNRNYEQYINTKVNKLTILKIGDKDKFNHATFTCQCECGTIKDIPITCIVRNRIISCGCYRLEVVKQKLGSKHHAWNPNKTDKEREQERHHTAEHIHWRTSVFARDKFICQSCKEQCRELRAHHLNCWALFPQQRFDINNGVTLCDSCHKWFHKLYGLKSTKEMYEDFIKKYGNVV